VRTARNALRMTQGDLAEAADMSSDMVSRIERGTTSASLEKIEAIAKALNVLPASLFGGEPPPKDSGRRGQALDRLATVLTHATDDQVCLIQRLAEAVRERREN